MSDPQFEQSRPEASDPGTPAARLAELAYAHPELRAAIAANPAAYDGLRAWIAANPGPEPEQEPATGIEARRRDPGSRRRTVLVAALAGGLAILLVGGGVATAAVLGAFGGGAPATSASEPDDGTSSGGSDAGGDDGTAAEPIAAPVPDPAPTVLILDASGSMVRDVPEGGTRMEAARAATTVFIEHLPDGIDIGLTVFGTGTGNSDAEQAAGCLDVKTVLPVAPLDRAAMTQAVAGIVESGYTPIGPALRHAAAQLPSAEPGVIVVVSDGVDTCAPPPSCDVATELRAANPALTIHAIGFHVDADEAATAALECVARAGGGEFFSATNAAQLAAKLRVVVDPGAASEHLTATGLDGLRIGMSLGQAQATVPGFAKGRTVAGVLYVDCDAAELRFRDGVLVEIRPKQRSTATVDAVAPGAPQADADRMYGAPIATGTDVSGAYADYATAPGSRTGYRVYAESGVITWIVICLCGPNAAAPDTDTGNWIIDFDRIGPITLATSREEASTHGGVQWAGSAGCAVWTMEADGASVAAFPDDGGATMFLSVQRDARLSDSPRTERGIGIGATLDQVRRAYPEARMELTTWEADMAVVTDEDRRISMLFVADVGTSTVQGILVGRISSPPLDWC
ncbi:VWA domain-containing protein [Agromyces sp. MMS24-K17]|uniref:vWA domain-containing protein n=1 Tax=Agromyces sp. MMS24-K17 TaxID=3372850 RepID=UPI003754B851